MATILVVEDDAISRRIIGASLQGRHEVVTAGDGVEALEAVRRKPCSLVLTDIIMPRMDGWRLVQALRTMPDTALIPVIVLTVLTQEHHRLRGFGLGADDFITKPVNPVELCARVDRALLRGESLGQATLHYLQESAAFTGDLAQIQAAALLTVLSRDRLTRRVQIARPGAVAVLWFEHGIITAARLTGDRPCSGIDAVYEVLGWWSGWFSVTPGSTDEPIDNERVGATLTFILLQAVRNSELTLSPGPR